MTSTEASSVAIMLRERDADAQKRNDRFWPIAENWRRSGIGVRVVCGLHPCTDSVVPVPRLDCSCIPDPYWRIIQNHPRAVNARVRDIRKTTISYLLPRDDPWDGPVIVQSLNNSGGYMDVKFGGTTPTQSLGRTPEVGGMAPVDRSPSNRLEAEAEQVPDFFPNTRCRNSRLAESAPRVRRFLVPDRDENGDEVLYRWFVFGGRGIGRSMHFPDPYVKSASSLLESYQSPPQSIIEDQGALGLDYGKIDYILHRGEAILLDVNWTQSVSKDAFSETYVNQCGSLANGLKAIVTCRRAWG